MFVVYTYINFVGLYMYKGSLLCREQKHNKNTDDAQYVLAQKPFFGCHSCTLCVCAHIMSIHVSEIGIV